MGFMTPTTEEILKAIRHNKPIQYEDDEAWY